MVNRSITHRVAKFALTDHLDRWSKEDFTLAKVALMDFICVSLAGINERSPQILVELAKDQGSKEQASVLGMPEKTSCLWAATINGTSSHIHDLDDVHEYLSIHLGISVCSTALAAAEYTGASGKQLLMSLLNGMQVSAGIAAAVYPAHYRQGWHGTSTIGAFGAAAAAGYLFQLTPEQMCCAFGIVASSFGGIRLNIGTMTKSYHTGFAAHQGLKAVLMAKKGFTANTEIFDNDFLNLISPSVDLHAILNRITGKSAIKELRFKSYPSCVTTHAAILGCLELVQKHNLAANDIKEVVQEVNRFSMSTVGTHYPKSGLDGKFSSTYCMSVAITKGTVDLESFRDEMLADPEIQKFLPRTKLIPNDEFNCTPRNGRTSITCYDGSVYQTEIKMFGSEYDVAERVRQVKKKYNEYAGLVLTRAAIEKTTTMIENLEQLEDIGTLTTTLSLS